MGATPGVFHMLRLPVKVGLPDNKSVATLTIVCAHSECCERGIDGSRNHSSVGDPDS